MSEIQTKDPLIVVVSTGGTIAMVPGQAPGVVPVLTADDLIAAVPRLAGHRIKAQSFSQVPGAHLTFSMIEALAEEIKSCVSLGAAGIVITQGTDTIEEVAFCLDCLLDLPVPVIVTGAMRGPSSEGADGPANLLASVQVALSECARGLGVLVVMNDQVHAARFVKKQHTASPSAFVSPLMGPIGWVAEGRVTISARLPTMPNGLARVSSQKDARVALLALGVDHDSALISLLPQANYEGLVVEALGGGHCNPSAADALEELAKIMPVVIASRTGSGQMLSATYGFKGGEIDLGQRGVANSGWLDGAKSRILLTLALRRGASIEQALELFRPYRA
jgi:L-asparaginase